jgi:mannobiose 2-epimerase
MKSIFCLSLVAGVATSLAGNPAATVEQKAKPPSEPAATMRAEFARSAEQVLRENILAFWLRYAPDQVAGGFYGLVKDDLTAVKSESKGSLLTCRILWTFSAAYRRYHDPAYLEMARRAYNDLLTRFWDEQNGGIYWSVSADGKPLNTSKQIYDQVFGIYALSEYYQVTSDQAVLDRAITLYRVVEKYAHDPVNGGYFEVFTRDWQRSRPTTSVVNSISTKSQNTHLHVMEAFTKLLRVWPDAGLKANHQALLELMLTRIYDSKTHHLRLFMTDDWTLRSDGFSYGHDIEAAWLMTEAASVLGDSGLIVKTRSVAVEIAETTLKEGVDRDGGVFNEGNASGVTDASKDWWPQAEAVVGFLNAYQISGDKRFFDAASNSWAFIEKRLVDRERGEWFQSVSRDGVVQQQPKISLWKCPYHNSRSCMEIMDRLASLAAGGQR